VGRIPDPVVRRFAARYLPRLRRRYQPELVLAFGSRARGEALAESDLDLLVVSERFRGVPFLERASTLLIHLDLPFATDVLCYTPEEFARKRREFGIVSLALKEGRSL
jgi:predicted nucleotidyltransferase